MPPPGKPVGAALAGAGCACILCRSRLLCRRFCGFGALLALHLGFLLELPGIAALGNIPDIASRFFALAQRLHTDVFILVLVNFVMHRRPGGMGSVHLPLLCLTQPAQFVRGQFRLAKPQMLCLFRSFIRIGFQLFLSGYPEKISAEQVEEEKAAVRKLFSAHKMPLVIELAITAAFVAFAAYVLYTTLYSDSARSKCISDSYLNLFPAEATVGEVLDDFFTDSKWDNYEQNGVTYVSYTGIGQNTQTAEKIEISIYFKLNNDKTFGIDRMTWNGDTMNTLEQLGVISALNDSYRESHGLASSNALDSAFDELENALDEALTDSASSEAAPESEAVSTSVTESVPYTETADAYDADDVFPAATRFDEQATSTNGMDTYSKLAGEISVEYNHYDELTEEIKEYFLSYGPYFRTAWLNAMYTDIYEDTGRYGNATALYDFVKYMSFYDEITSYYDPAPMSQAFHDVILSMEDQIYVDTATDREAAPYVDEVIQTAEANGAELQIW